MAKDKDYSKLHKTFSYDKEKATLLAEAMTELVELKKREKYLTKLLSDNPDLKQFLWGSQDGRVTAFHDIEDEHLENILAFLPRRGREVPEALATEAVSRGMELPDNARLSLGAGDEFDGIDYEYPDLDD